jgi:hypothetical protein
MVPTVPCSRLSLAGRDRFLLLALDKVPRPDQDTDHHSAPDTYHRLDLDIGHLRARGTVPLPVLNLIHLRALDLIHHLDPRCTARHRRNSLYMVRYQKGLPTAGQQLVISLAARTSMQFVRLMGFALRARPDACAICVGVM